MNKNYKHFHLIYIILNIYLLHKIILIDFNILSLYKEIIENTYFNICLLIFQCVNSLCSCSASETQFFNPLWAGGEINYVPSYAESFLCPK